METYGNQNLLFANGGQYVAYAGTSEVTSNLNSLTIAVELVSTTDCWVKLGAVGEETPAAVKPIAESTRTAAIPLRAGVEKVIAVPLNPAGAHLKIAVIQDATGGTLYVTERRE